MLILSFEKQRQYINLQMFGVPYDLAPRTSQPVLGVSTAHSRLL